MIAAYKNKETGKDVYVQSFLETMVVDEKTVSAVTFELSGEDDDGVLHIMEKKSFLNKYEKK